MFVLKESENQKKYYFLTRVFTPKAIRYAKLELSKTYEVKKRNNITTNA